MTSSLPSKSPSVTSHAADGALRGPGLRARRRDLLAEHHVPRGARQAPADFLLVGRMDVVAIADVDGHRQTGIAVRGHRAPLRIAQPRPATIYRRGRELVPVRELHHEERQRRIRTAGASR